MHGVRTCFQATVAHSPRMHPFTCSVVVAAWSYSVWALIVHMRTMHAQRGGSLIAKGSPLLCGHMHGVHACTCVAQPDRSQC